MYSGYYVDIYVYIVCNKRTYVCTLATVRTMVCLVATVI